MIHGTQKSIAAGCDCNLCELVQHMSSTRSPSEGSVSVATVRAHLDALADQGWTMKDLADHIGYHRNTLYNIRGGKTLAVTRYVAEDILSVPIKEHAA